MLTVQLINFRKEKSENLKFRIEIGPMKILSSRFLKNSLDQESELVHSTHASAYLSNISFNWRPIVLQTLVAINSESCQRSFQSMCALPSEVAVLFYWNLSRRPRSAGNWYGKLSITNI